MSAQKESSERLSLSETHKRVLMDESGISEAVIEAAGICSVTEKTGQAHTGYSNPGMVFTYYDLSGKAIGTRTRLDKPLERDDGGKIKYLQQKGVSLGCYFVPGALPAILDPAKPIYLTEGEKKCLSIQSSIEPDSAAVVAIPGCWNFKDKNRKGLNAVLGQIPFKGRTVIFVPDTDFYSNPSVREAGEALVSLLLELGAIISLIDLGMPEGGGRIGADDFLVEHGAAGFQNRCSIPAWRLGTAQDSLERLEANDASIREYLRHYVCSPQAETDLLFEQIKRRTKIPIGTIRKIYGEIRKEWDGLKHFKKRVTARREVSLDSGIPRAVLLDGIAEEIKSDGRFYKYGKELLFIEGGKEIVFPESFPAKLTDIGLEFFSEDKDGNPQYRLMPQDLAKAAYHGKRLRGNIDEILVFADHPIYDGDWRLARPGYNPHEKIFYNGSEITPVREITLLHELVKDFLFKNEASRCNFLAMLISSLLRNKFMGNKPFGAFTGNRPNIGKTLACKIIAYVAEGRPAETMSYNSNQEETEKQIAARVEAGDVLIIDNVRSSHPIASTVIERLVTDLQVSFRRLGQSKTITRPNSIVVLITMNAAQFNQDLTSRALPIEFYLDEEIDTQRRSFTHGSLDKFVLHNRVRILQELCGMVETWKEKGRPLCKKNFRFHEWTAEIGGILLANGFTAFLDNLEAAQADYDQVAHEIGRLFEDFINRAMTAEELIKSAAQQNLFSEIRGNRQRAATALSNILAKYRDKKVPLPGGVFVILREGRNPSKKVKTYTAVALESSNSKASGGRAETVSPEDAPGTRDESVDDHKENAAWPGTPGTGAEPGEPSEGSLSHNAAPTGNEVPAVPGDRSNSPNLTGDSCRATPPDNECGHLASTDTPDRNPGPKNSVEW